MATDLERLAVSLDADIKKFESAMRRATAVTNQQMKAVESRAKTMGQSVNLSLSDIGKGVGAFIAADLIRDAVREFTQFSDAATRVDNALKVAGLSGSELEKVYERLYASARKNAAPIESLVTLYGRVSIVQNQLGASTEDLLKFTDNIAAALRVAGTDAQAASGALMQLSQALGGGTVRAEEFNSILEGAPTIIRAAAAGIKEAGGSVAKLRQLMLAGELSSEAFFRGFNAGAVQLQEQAAKSTLTIGQSFTNLNNALVNLAREFNQATGAGETFASNVDGIAQAIGRVDVSGLIDKIRSVRDELEAAGNAQIFKDFNKWMGITDAEGNLINPDVKDAEKKIAAYEKEIEDLQKRITLNTELGFDNREALARLDEVRKALAALRTEAAKLPDTISGIAPDGTPTDYSGTNGLMGGSTIRGGARRVAVNPISLSDYGAKPQMSVDEFFKQRNAEAMRTEMERSVDTRAKAIIDAAAKLGITLDQAAAKLQARTEIASETAAKSFDGAISGFVDRVVSAESAGDPTAKNPRSTATGAGQFIESTWLALFRKYYPEQAATMGRDAILALRTDAETSKRLIEAYARENAELLKAAGVSVNEAALQLAHFLGPNGAINVLKAAPGTPVANVLDKGAIKANPEILGGGATVDDVIAYAQKRAGMTTAGTKALDSRESFQTSLAEQQRMLEALKAETGIRASLNPLVNDYGRKLTEVEKAQELLRMAQDEGTAAGRELSGVQQLLSGDLSQLSPAARQQAEAMRALAQNYGMATAEANKLKASQDQLGQSAQAAAQLQKDVLGGVLTDLRTAMADGKITAKEWKEVLVNALNKVADKLQEMLLNQLFSGSNGGIFGFLFGGGTSFNPAGKVGLFSSGGYTGAGGKYDPAGIVHKGEYVFDQESVKRIGLDRLRALHGYASGGLVGSAPRLPDLSGMGRGANRNDQGVHVTVGFKKDGLNLEPEVVAVASRVGRAGMENYRKNQLHGDIDSHMRNPRRRGSI